MLNYDEYVGDVSTPYNKHLGELAEFVTTNISLVHKICRRYKKYLEMNRHVGEYDDFVSIGTIGLINAYTKFDPTKGAGNDGKGIKFSTYGVPMILGEIRRHVRDTDAGARFSRGTKEAYYKINNANMLDELPAVIAEKLDMVIETVQLAMEYHVRQYPRYLDSVIFENGGDPITLGDTVYNEESDYDWIDRKLLIQQFMSSVPDREKEILRLMGNGLSQIEAGKVVGISQVQVSRLRAALLAKAEKFGVRFSQQTG